MDKSKFKMCRVDGNRIFTGEVTEPRIDLSNISDWVFAEPPSTGKTWKHTPYGWVEYTETAPIEQRKVTYTRIEFIDMIDKAGLSNSLGVLLSQSPLIIREQWYANPTINITDPRVVAFFNMASIDLNTLFK